jgi:hypothetical protein
MQTLRKSMHLSLIVAFLWASFGFRVEVSHCAKGMDLSVGLATATGCCCGKAAKVPAKPCKAMTCALPQAVFTHQASAAAATQPVAKKAVKEQMVVTAFMGSIRPALLDKLPLISLPPPASGRTLGILHQTFLI